jgi:hypothetical protein
MEPWRRLAPCNVAIGQLFSIFDLSPEEYGITHEKLAFPLPAAFVCDLPVSTGRHIGAEAMSLYVLDAISWIFGIRGHIPQCDDFGVGRGVSSLADGGKALPRVLVGLAASVAFLSLALGAVVALAVRLL